MAIDWQEVLEPSRLGVDAADVHHLEIREMTDWQGDPGLAVDVVLAAPITVEQLTYELFERIRRPISDTVRQAEPDRFPYISFRTLEEWQNPEPPEDDEMADAA